MSASRTAAPEASVPPAIDDRIAAATAVREGTSPFGRVEYSALGQRVRASSGGRIALPGANE